MLEVEVKIKADIKKIEEKLKDVGFQKGVTHTEIDTYFNGEYKNLKEEDKALRIREKRNYDLAGTNLNFKGPKVDGTTMTREELEFDIPSYEAGESLLKGLGFFPVARVEKQRLQFTKGNITCCLDNVMGLGEFLEIEIMAQKEEYDTAISQINELLETLSLNIKDTIRESYLCMLQNVSHKEKNLD